MVGRTVWLVSLLALVTRARPARRRGRPRPRGGSRSPSGLTTTSIVHDAVTLSWDDSEDGSVTHYQVLRLDRDSDSLGVFAVIVFPACRRRGRAGG